MPTLRSVFGGTSNWFMPVFLVQFVLAMVIPFLGFLALRIALKGHRISSTVEWVIWTMISFTMVWIFRSMAQNEAETEQYEPTLVIVPLATSLLIFWFQWLIRRAAQTKISSLDE